MNWSVFYGILIPFLGTSFGAACVFFMKKEMGDRLQRMLTGFAAGVMVAASIWSLLIPAMEQVVDMGKLAFVPAVAGFWCGILFLLLLDHIIPHLHRNSQSAEGPKSQLKRTTMLVLAVTLHNIPEGMALCMRGIWRAAPRFPRRPRWRCRLESRFRISRRGRLFPCRFGRREPESRRHS